MQARYLHRTHTKQKRQNLPAFKDHRPTYKLCGLESQDVSSGEAPRRSNTKRQRRGRKKRDCRVYKYIFDKKTEHIQVLMESEEFSMDGK